MQPLEKILRNKLERTIKEARDIAETAAKSVLQQLGVGEAKPFDYLTGEERNLRRRLRTHGRQLGDLRNANTEIQEIDRLIEEVAYEHWHRMLFARFLAENNLLMYPDPDDPVVVSLEECEDLAADEGAKNGWELAARYATRMLPQIFRIGSPVFELLLPSEHQQKLEKRLTDLEPDVFLASDSLGWVYQFWQSKRKDEVNASEVKIGSRELPAVTQLFTEPYMVSFLLDNSLGAWWAGKRLSENDLKSANSEEELREKASLPGVPLEYLRFVKEENESWTPAAGTFERWPENLGDLKTLDPCCGSGHFLVAAFLMLVPMRMELEGLSAKDAVDVVLIDNLHGLEIDQRCVEIAAFNVAITAWNYTKPEIYLELPNLNLACSGLSLNKEIGQWISNDYGVNLQNAMEELYNQFRNDPLLGSLINPFYSLNKGTIFESRWEELQPHLEKAIVNDSDVELTELGITAKGLLKNAEILSNKYHLVITNPPFLKRGNQKDKLKDLIENIYPESKDELATTFLERCIEFCNKEGIINEGRELASKCDKLLEFADEDGIVCISAVRGEMKAEDRLDSLLAAVWGDDWSSNKKSELLAHVGHAGKSMESWYRDKFFVQHCKLFHHRPFIWQVWDGLNDGFSALVNYHKLDKKLLETLIYTYLGDWTNRQKSDLDNGIDGAAEKLAAAESLKRKLELILEGEAPYDVFVRWKPIEEQSIGWDPDLNDGVRMNIRPFMSVPDIRKKGAGILRDKPNIKWGKDRGKDVESSPWYHLFKGDRINDHHLTLDEKLNVRKSKEDKS